MLGALEEILQSPLRSALPEGATLHVGPTAADQLDAAVEAIVFAVESLTTEADNPEPFLDRQPCRVSLSLSAWASAAEDADVLLRTALKPLLLAVADLDVLEVPGWAVAEPVQSRYVRMRLVAPRCRLRSLHRSAENGRIHARATVELVATLYLVIATEPAPAGPQLARVLVEPHAAAEDADSYRTHHPLVGAEQRPIADKLVIVLKELGSGAQATLAAENVHSIIELRDLEAAAIERLEAQLPAIRRFQQRAHDVLALDMPLRNPESLLDEALHTLAAMPPDELIQRGYHAGAADVLLASMGALQALLTAGGFRDLTLLDLVATS